MNTRRISARLAAALALAIVAVGGVAAQSDYPNRPIRLVVAAGPGDNTDILARLLADDLQGRLGQPVVVENKPGASGVLAGSAVSIARPDGYTLLFGQMSTLIISPQVIHPMPYDTTKAFTPIVRTQQGASILVVNRSVPARTLNELVQIGKAKPEELRLAVNNLGSAQHLAMEIVQGRTGARFNTIPYKGTAPALRAVVTGESDITVASALAAQQHIDSGVLRPLAVYGARPMPQVPNLPTLSSALDIPELNHDFWYGVVGPAGLGKDVVSKLSSAVHAAMATPRIAEMMQRNAQSFVPNSPEEFAREIAGQWATFGRIARASKIDTR